MNRIICVLIFILAPALASAEDCQYRLMELSDVSSGPTVISVRTTRGSEKRLFGYDESGVYPWKVYYEWCGSGWTVEYRLGSVCTFWTGTYMNRRKTSDGKRQEPCVWSAWVPAEFDRTAEPKAPVILAKLDSLP